jgi:hypothetical protein
MSERRPPALALWLLDRLGLARGNAPLVGDLLEDFHNDRSELWFWRQTLTAIANGMGHRVALQQVYWIAVAMGFAAQLPVSLVLFRLQVPHPIHEPGWKIAAFLAIIIGASLMPLLGVLAFGKNSKDLKLILVKPGAGAIEQGTALIGVTALESFGSILLLYCACCLISSSPPFSSYAEVAGWEFVWLVTSEGTSALVAAITRKRKSRRAEEETRKDREWATRAWVHLKELEVSLICSDGAVVRLDPETCMTTIFASANEEFITALFKDGVSVEDIRRAIGLASAVYYLGPRRHPISKFARVPVSKFARLLAPGTDEERMTRYLDGRPAESFPKRVLRHLAGGN